VPYSSGSRDPKLLVLRLLDPKDEGTSIVRNVGEYILLYKT